MTQEAISNLKFNILVTVLILFVGYHFFIAEAHKRNKPLTMAQKNAQLKVEIDSIRRELREHDSLVDALKEAKVIKGKVYKVCPQGH